MTRTGLTRPRVCAVLALAAAGAGGVATVAVANASPSPTAAQLVNSAMNDATIRGSVHEAESGRTGTERITDVEDVTESQGHRTIATSSDGRVQVLVVADTAYLIGDKGGWTRYFGFPAKVVAKIGARWVSIPATSSGYTTASEGATLSTALGFVRPTGRLSETPPTKLNGAAAVGIRGTGPPLVNDGPPSSVTLYVSSSAKPMPLRAALTDPKGDSYTVTFSSWGEHVSLKAPAAVIAIAKLT